MKFFRFTGENGEEYRVSLHNHDWVSVGIGLSDLSIDWRGKFSLPIYVAMLEFCIHRRPEYGSRIDYFIEYRGGVPMIFDLSIRVFDGILDEAVVSGKSVIEEILQPIREVENLIGQSINVQDAAHPA